MDDYRGDVYRLMLATNRCVGFYTKTAKENHIKENTLLLMDILSDGKQHSQKQICKDWVIPKTTLNTIVGECVKKGYIVLLQQEHSKEKLISLTDTGKLFAETVTAEMKNVVQQAMEKIKKEYPFDFISAYEKYVDYLQQECGTEQGRTTHE